MTPTEADNLVRAELGPEYTPVKLSGVWLIHHKTPEGVRTLVAQRRTLPLAIADAKALQNGTD